MVKKSGTRGSIGALNMKAGGARDPPPEIPSIRKKSKKKKWNLPPIPVIVVAAAILAHFVYIYLFPTGGQDVNPVFAKELFNKAKKLVEANQLLKSLEVLDHSLRMNPNAPSPYNTKAGVLRMLGRSDEALTILKEGDDIVTLHHGKDYKDLFYIKQGLFYAYRDAGQSLKAVANIKRATELNPTAGLYISWANVEDGSVSDDEKIELLTKALALEPDNVKAFCLRYHRYAILGEWAKLTSQYAQVLEYQRRVMTLKGRTETTCLQPYMLAYLDFTAEMMKETAELFASRETAVGAGEKLSRLLPSQVPAQFDSNTGERIRKLRIGYVSSDLQNHPVGRNVLGLLLGHNKAKYEIYCFSTKHIHGDTITATIQRTVNYVDLTKLKLSHFDIAKKIREEYKIDVLIDLNGWTEGRRLEIFAAMPAPVQIAHGLGFVGTNGVDAFQYFITDRIATPKRFSHLYTEQLVRLPHAYLPASHKNIQITDEGEDFNPRTVDKMAVRKTEQLPENDDVFVYCSFQSMQKISEKSFDTWMRILRSSRNSVLWFTGVKGSAQSKLLHRAEHQFGIASDRIVFGATKRLSTHMVRAQACDLMLDAWPYNAHSTAVDGIWAGVPLLVYLPDYHVPNATEQVPKMASRVSASLLNTLEMPQLIKATIGEYEDEAVRLSNDRLGYQVLRNELLDKRLTSPLFNLKSYTRDVEMTYSELFEAFKRGDQPRPLSIPPLKTQTITIV